MLNYSDSQKRIGTFLVITFLLSAIFWGVIWQAGSTKVGGGILTLALMWCPGIAALVTTLIFQHNVRRLGWRSGNLGYSLLAYVLPIAYCLIVYGYVWLTGLGGFTTQNVPAGQPLFVFVLVNATIVFLLGGVLSALGEEIGWRGLLVPELAKLTSFTNVALISGVIWTIWHLPLLVFSDYNSGAPTWYTLICFAVLAMGLSFALAWLRLRSNSLWPAVILHGSHNLFVQAIFDPLTADKGITRYITTEFGIGLALVGLAIALIFWKIANAGVQTPPVNATQKGAVV